MDLQKQLDKNKINTQIWAAKQDKTIKSVFMLLLDNYRLDMANHTKKTTPPTKLAPVDASDVTQQLLSQLPKNYLREITKTKTKTQKKQLSALYTPPTQSNRVVCTKVDSQDKWTATIMNDYLRAKQKEEEQWCQHCNNRQGMWIINQENVKQWIGSHNAWVKKQTEYSKKIYRDQLSNSGGLGG